MRKIVLLTAIILAGIAPVCSQNNIGICTSTPNSNALVHIACSTKGILISRTSTTTRLSIPAVKGKLLYDTTTVISGSTMVGRDQLSL